MDQTTMGNQIFNIMGGQNISNNQDFGDTTGLKNPLFNNVNPVINQNSNSNNDFFYMKGMENPMNNFINEDNNLDEQLDKLNNVIIILKSDIDRVRTGIDELKILITNINMYRHKNMYNNMNMINKSINNNLINNSFNKNNMMNVDFLNNMTNSKMNINMMMNNNDNIMNMMSKNLNPMIETNQLTKMKIEEYDVIFRKGDVITRIKCKNNEKVADIIERYRDKSSDEDKNIKFIFNAKELDINLTILEACIKNNANIYVVLPKKQ